MAQAKVTAPKKPTALGFGFQPELSEHFFLLTLPRSKGDGAEVTLSEHFEWFEPTDEVPIPVPLNSMVNRCALIPPGSRYVPLAVSVAV